MKTSFESRVSRMGLGSFVDINIFVVKYYFIKFLHILHFLKFLKSKSTQLPRPQKGNSGVSFNDTLLNFGLWGKFGLLLVQYTCTQYLYMLPIPLFLIPCGNATRDVSVLDKTSSLVHTTKLYNCT